MFTVHICTQNVWIKTFFGGQQSWKPQMFSPWTHLSAYWAKTAGSPSSSAQFSTEPWDGPLSMWLHMKCTQAHTSKRHILGYSFEWQYLRAAVYCLYMRKPTAIARLSLLLLMWPSCLLPAFHMAPPVPKSQGTLCVSVHVCVWWAAKNSPPVSSSWRRQEDCENRVLLKVELLNWDH